MIKPFASLLDHHLAALHLRSKSLNVGSVLDSESRVWLNCIYRRLAGKVGIRKPYYGEITRSIPFDIFLCLKEVLRDLNAKEPNCYFAQNNKAQVISLTSSHLVHRLFACLSGQTPKKIKSYFKQTLTGLTRHQHKVRLIISTTKDFAFVYKKRNGQLVLQFYYGEWNYHGNPQHFD